MVPTRPQWLHEHAPAAGGLPALDADVSTRRANLGGVRLRSDRHYRFDVGPGDLWARLADVSTYPQWWPWLREFDGAALAAGEVWRCTVQPPLPYRVRFAVHLEDVAPHSSVTARVSGEIVGTATLTISPADGGSTVRLVADLGPDRQALRALSVAFRPLVRYGHNWVLDNGAKQFADGAG
jgi:Polyketide cyclase / dehydrase and lipid transport